MILNYCSIGRKCILSSLLVLIVPICIPKRPRSSFGSRNLSIQQNYISDSSLTIWAENNYFPSLNTLLENLIKDVQFSKKLASSCCESSRNIVLLNHYSLNGSSCHHCPLISNGRKSYHYIASRRIRDGRHRHLSNLRQCDCENFWVSKLKPEMLTLTWASRLKLRRLVENILYFRNNSLIRFFD